MKIFKKVVLSLLFILLVFCGYVQYKKSKFDKIYAQRESPHKYDILYSSGALNQFKNFVINNYDLMKELSDSAYKGKINLVDLKRYTKDTIVINAIGYLTKNRFFDVYIEKIKNTNKIEIYFEKIYLQYKVTPTYHCIIYSMKREYEYRFNKNDYWYFFHLTIENMILVVFWISDRNGLCLILKPLSFLKNIQLIWMNKWSVKLPHSSFIYLLKLKAHFQFTFLMKMVLV